MRISEKKKMELYNAMREGMTQIRLAIIAEQREGYIAPATANRLDRVAFEWEIKVWKMQREVLGIKD